MSSSTSLNASDDVAVECNDNVGSDAYLINDDPLLDDDEQAASDSLEDLDKPEPAPAKRRPCLNRTGVVVVGAAVAGVFVVIGVLVVVVLSVLSLHKSANVGRHDATDTSPKVTNVPPSTRVQSSKPVTISLTLHDNCSTRISGTAEDGVTSFKGIPYAVAPIGKLRWQAAVPASDKTFSCPAELDASRYGSRCVQFDGGTLAGNEDCLFLNVWTPADVDFQTSDLDVMVNIHDGGLMTGSGHEPSRIPSSDLIRSANAVFVSFNYRLNVFGFLALDILSSAKEPDASGNYGFMDQITALRWVQQHIRSFGGDPNKVTVYGSGSGATSISTLLASSSARRLFSRAWLSNPSPKPQRSLAEAVLQNEAFFNETVCAEISTDAVQQSNCLCDLSVDSLMSVFPWKSWLNEHFYSVPSPLETSTAIAIVDGSVIQQSTLTAWQQQRSFNDVPLLISSADQASDVKLTPASVNTWFVMKYFDYIHQRFLPFIDNDDITNVDEILHLYSGNSSTTGTPELCISSLVSDMRATCPLDEMARVAASVSQSPVYRFQVSYQSERQHPSDGGRNYAYRGIDVDAFYNSVRPPGAAEAWLSLVDNVRHVVLQFMHTGAVGGWQTFPEASYNISAVISNATVARYLSERCIYWREHGFFPQYAWMN